MAKVSWKLHNVKIADIKEFSKNPRWLTEKAKKNIKKSLDEFGLIEKLVLNSDMVLIGGHQRLHILSEQGETHVECWMPDRQLTEREHSKLCIMLNKAQAEFDFDMLANEWDIDLLNEAGFDLKELGLDDSMEEDSEENDSALEPSKNPITLLGDLFVLGNHRLVCGDCTSAESVSKLLNGDCPILMVTDPPYGVEYDPTFRNSKKGIGGKKTGHAVGNVKNDHIKDWTKSYKLFSGSVLYIWHAGKYCAEVQKNIEDCDFEIINQVIWAKHHFALSRGDYHWQHEPCWYAVKKGQKHNWQDARDQSTLWEIDSFQAVGSSHNADDERTAHSTQKPLECMARPIRNNTKEGEGVYDPFCGSGTTLIACEKLNRKCYAMELDPAYCDIIVKRWMDATGLMPIKNGIELTEFEYAESTDTESA